MADAKVYKNYINGEWVESVTKKTFENKNPADTREVLGIFQKSNEEDVKRAVDAAKEAFRKWRLVPAPKRAEIVFRIAGKEEKAQLRDYSLGGVSFLMGSNQHFNPGDEVTDLILTLPQGKAVVSYPIAQAIVRRIEEHFEDRGRLCGLEFLKLEKKTQQRLAQHLFEEQRLLLRQGRKI